MDSVQPLRISKTTPSNSPNKMMATSRPLAEIGTASPRRNSPSYNQATKKMIVSRESSPYTENSSPFTSPTKASPRDFWSPKTMTLTRFDENTPDRSPSPSLISPKRRSSIERLKQASRVKNSNIFALESKDAYDPSTTPIVERPSANRPLSQQLANNSFTRFDSLRKENNPMRSPQRGVGHKRTDSEITLPFMSPTKLAAEVPLPASPEKHASPSPTKSSISRTSKYGMSPSSSFDPENGTWSDEERAPTPRGTHHPNKSVTFHEDPPVINEYEQQTPEPSVSVGSRESSWDSDDYADRDISFDRGSSADAMEREDSFDEDLENADKTPVVLPEDWTRMSPEEARTDLVNDEDDVFDSPSQQRPILGRSESVTSDGDARPLPPLPSFMTEGRNRRDSGSLAATAEKVSHAARGLPSPPKRASCSKDDIMRMTRESSLTLNDRLRLMSEHSTNSDRPVSNSSQETAHGQPEELTITNLDTGEKMEVQVRVAEASIQEADEEVSELPDLADFADEPPRISRESILRRVRNTKYDYEEDEDEVNDDSYLDINHDSPARPDYAELARMDPDQPIPSREHSRETSENQLLSRFHEQEREVQIKDEPLDDNNGINMNAIPALEDSQLEIPQPPRSPSRLDDYDRQSSVLHHQMRSSESAEADDDDASRYSHSEEPDAESTMLHQREATVEEEGKESLQDAMGLLSVKDYSEPAPMSATAARLQQPDAANNGSFMGLPAYLSSEDFDFGMKEYITHSPPAVKTNDAKQLQVDVTAAPPMLQPSAEFQHPRDLYAEPVAEVSPPASPASSVIHRSSDVSSLHEQERQLQQGEIQRQPSPVQAVPDSAEIPERRATIRTGGKLKARKSGSQADIEAMAHRRRLVSSEHPVPAVPAEYQDERVHPEELDAQNRSMTLDLSIPEIECGTNDLGLLGLEGEFDRVIENQKVHCDNIYSPHAVTNLDRLPQKGYLMRQNTKVVVATNRNFSGDSGETVTGKTKDVPMSPTTSRSAKSSPRKPSAEQFLKTEPWNGKTRRKSVRNASAQKPACVREPAPPLPGQESALLDVVNEDAASMMNDDTVAEGVERGRLFVKVVGVKNLDLPMPKNDRVYFQLTLDNGLHCVTTSNLELGQSAAIGQEFELVVLNDLEFQLTLTTKLPPPPAAVAAPASIAPSSPTKSLKSHKSTGFSRFLLSSPKKRAAERERLEREAAEEEAASRRLRDERASQQKRPASAWDALRELVNATDGAFARSYVNLSAHEEVCYGRPLTVDVPCYNEWALERDQNLVANSVRSKRGTQAGPIRRPPYVVGQLELQLLFVPRPKGSAGDEGMPKSMSAAVREMNKATEVEAARREREQVGCEGHLSQQGGDCAHWRRRFFRLQSGKLTAYHEHTHQKRAVINLAKATRVVDDRSTLVADPASSASPSKSKGRRKSAFAEEDEGYNYVEEGFRIRFANGETIDFYADSRAEKDRWMVALGEVMANSRAMAGKSDDKSDAQQGPQWTELVLAREQKIGGSEAGKTASAANGPTPAGPTTERKNDFTRPPPSSTSSPMKPAALERNPSERKPVSSATSSRSVPSSPVKNGAQSRYAAPAPALPTAGGRPRTPPMKARTGHRSRDAVKSMIF